MRRRLSESEITEAELVFAQSLNYSIIWVHEEQNLPNLIGRLGAALNREAPPARNAITLRNHLYFPIRLDTSADAILEMRFTHMAWLIHELTHAWQYQHTGIRYLWDAIKVQVRKGRKSYDFGGEEGLQDALDEQKHFLDFNPEQQGAITQSYYVSFKSGAPTDVWDPFIDQIQSTP
ncbi:MAG: hypothetical protein GTO18_07400 [Anaerolineales bacterium]|nr:hypothetical protein [Anaerolineales bacterium]